MTGEEGKKRRGKNSLCLAILRVLMDWYVQGKGQEVRKEQLAWPYEFKKIVHSVKLKEGKIGKKNGQGKKEEEKKKEASYRNF